MTPGPHNTGDAKPAGRWLGLLLLAHFAVVVTIKCTQGRSPELLWLSHLTLGLSALAILTGRARLARIALAAIAVPHLLWLGDAAMLLATGRSPLNITAYLAHATPAEWAATTHHFYLLPLLGLILHRRGGWDRVDALGAWALVTIAFTLGRTLSTPAQNVNYAHGLLGSLRHPAIDWINTAPPTTFAIFYLAITALIVVIPGSAIAYASTRPDPGNRLGSSLGVRNPRELTLHAKR